ncbi:MAG: hypothetical protein H0V62_12020 [Gammaproteobacteria bacterium]|nr:hypothetical protein [Gammaproteobacteria bacterium]
MSDPDNPQIANEGAVVNDGASLANAGDLFMDAFPYLGTPLPGSPSEASEP